MRPGPGARTGIYSARNSPGKSYSLCCLRRWSALCSDVEDQATDPALLSAPRATSSLPSPVDAAITSHANIRSANTQWYYCWQSAAAYRPYNFHSVLRHCWLGDRKGIRPVKGWVLGFLVVTIWLQLCTSYSSSCHHHLYHSVLQQNPECRHCSTSLPGLTWKTAVIRACKSERVW